MGACDGVPVLGVLGLLALLAALPAALALARAARRGAGASAARTGAGGRLINLAFPSIRFCLVVVEVILLWHVLADRHATSATPFRMIEDLLGCSSFARSDALLLSGWLLPHAVACALLLWALGHQMLAGLGRLAQKQGTREPETPEAGEVGGQPQSSSGSSLARAAEALRAAVADALASCTLVFLLAHVVVAQAAFRGLSCGMGVESQGGIWAEDQGCGNFKRWGPFTILAVLLNVAAPTFILAWIVCSAQKWSPMGSGTELAGSRAAGGDSFVSALKGQVVCFGAAFVPRQPWLPGQLILDALVVAFAEMGMASGTEQGRQLGLACSQIVVFAEVLLLLWPRWLLNDRLLRFNVTMRLSLLLASHLNEAAAVHATWPWPVAVAAAAIWAARWLFDRFADGRAVRALQAVACSLGLRFGGSKQPTVPFDPEVGLARDLSQGSLWVALSDPAQLCAICGGLSRDESACLAAAAGLAAARLPRARAEDPSTVSLHCDNSLELLSTSVTRDILGLANLSAPPLTQNTSGSLDWVAPLPLLATDDDGGAGRKRARDGQSQERTMLTKKWLLDHFVPASNGPDVMNDAMNLGAPAVQSVEEIMANPPRSYHSRSHRRFALNSRSAEDLIKMPNAKASEILSKSRGMGGLLSQSSTSGVPKVSPKRPEQQPSTPVPTFEFQLPETNSEVPTSQCDTAWHSSNARSSEATSSQPTWNSEGQCLANVALGPRGGDMASSSSSRAEGSTEGFAKTCCFKPGTLFDSPDVPRAGCEQNSSLQCSPRTLAPPAARPELRPGRSADSLSRDSRTSTAEVIVPFSSEGAASVASRGSRGDFSASSLDWRGDSKKSSQQVDEDCEQQASEAWSPGSPSTPAARGGRPDAWGARPQQLKFDEVPFPEPYRKLLAVAPPHSLLRTLSARCESLGHLPAVEETLLDDCLSQKSPSVFSRGGSLVPTTERKQVLRGRSGTSELASPVPTYETLQIPTCELLLMLPEAQEQRGDLKASDASGGPRARHTDDKSTASSRMRIARVPSELSIASSRDTYDLLQSAIHMSQDHLADRTLRKQMDALRAENARLRQESEDMKAKRGERRNHSVPCQVQAAEAEDGPEADAHPAVAVAAALEAVAAAAAAGKEEELEEADGQAAAAAEEEEKGQPSTRCTTASGAQTAASSAGSSTDPPVDDSKEAQWARWKARKEAKKAKAGRTTYGQMLRNMTD